MRRYSLSGLGERIQEARKRARTPAGKRMTQGELAQKIGVTANTISEIERGRIPRDVNLIYRVAEATGVPVEWLLGDPEPPTPAEVEAARDVSARALSTEGRAELPPEVAKAARRLVDAFKREAALGGASPEELHYIETVLMTPNLPPTLYGGHIPPDKLLQHIQALMEPLRVLLRDLGRHV